MFALGILGEVAAAAPDAVVWTSNPTLFNHWTLDGRDPALAWHTGSGRLLWEAAGTTIPARTRHVADAGDVLLEPSWAWPLIAIVLDDQAALEDPRNEQAITRIIRTGRSASVALVLILDDAPGFNVLTSYERGWFAWTGTAAERAGLTR